MELIKMFKLITKMCQRNWLPLSIKLVAISKWTFIFIPLSVIISIVSSMHVIDFDNKKLQVFRLATRNTKMVNKYYLFIKIAVFLYLKFVL